jgi:hypothetical protein
VKRTDLLRSADNDPAWRSGAVFSREELEALLTDERIPADRRVLYALLGLVGLRFGEVAALRHGAAPLASRRRRSRASRARCPCIQR